MHHRLRLWLVFCVALLAPALSWAQGIVMPEVVQDVPVVYPKSAITEGYFQHVEVILELVLDESGAVTDVTVDTPRGHGFDEAAMAAARRLRFSPAKKNGKPVPARIKYKYVFDPPPAESPGASSTATRASPSPARRSRSALRTAYALAQKRRGRPLDRSALPPGSASVTVTAGALEPFTQDVDLARAERVDVTTRLQAPAPAAARRRKRSPRSLRSPCTAKGPRLRFRP